MKKCTALLLSLCMAALLAACGGGAGTSVIPAGSLGSGNTELRGIVLALTTQTSLFSGDTATLRVTLMAKDGAASVDAAAQLNNLEFVCSNTAIGTLAGPTLQDGAIQYTLSQLAAGSAEVQVKTKDGTVASNTLTLQVIGE